MHNVKTVPTMYKSKTFQLTTSAAILHCTTSKAALEKVFPRLLFATHWYSPLSVLLTFVIVNCLLSSEILMLELSLVVIGDPFLVHDSVGLGFPSASQDKTTSSPSLFVSVSG